MQNVAKWWVGFVESSWLRNIGDQNSVKLFFFEEISFRTVARTEYLLGVRLLEYSSLWNLYN